MPAVDLGPDFDACIGDTILVNLLTGPEFGHYIFPQPLPFENDYWVVNGYDSIPSTWDHGVVITHLASGCSISDTVKITAIPPPQAGMILPETVCDLAPIQGFDASSGYIESYEWTFYSNMSTIWTYNTPDVSAQLPPATWNVMLVVANAACGNDTIIQSVQVHPGVQYPGMLPDTVCLDEEIIWDYEASDSTVTWVWDFGDGTNASTATPSHAYRDTGSFQLEVISGFPACEDTLTHVVVVKTCDVTSVELPHLSLNVYPNPASDMLIIDGLQHQASNISLTDLQGRLIYQEASMGAQIGIPVTDLAPGMYLLEVRQKQGIWTGTIQIIH